jgi:heme-degrading monooxygenase HmoA
MSVCIIVKLKVDPANMAKLFAERANELKAVSEQGKAAGAIHHFFAAGDGEVIIVDEWDSADSFQKFFQSNTTIPEIMQSAGVQGAPEFSFYESMDSPDRF